MMRALLLGAFATTAFGVECGKDVGAVACRNLGSTSDFNIQNDPNGNANLIIQTGSVTINQAIQFIGDTPWDKSADLSNQAGNGCTFRDQSALGDNAAGTAPSGSGMGVLGSEYTCSLTSGTVCTGGTNDASADRTYSLSHSLQHMVSSLDNAGRFSVYFQRVLENPITGAGVTLKWIAENACKIYVDVEFQCTGGNCVEVTTIVCASFAGISATNNGVVSIECKVPAGFAIAKDSLGTTVGANLAEASVANTLTSTANDDAVWPGASPVVTVAAAVTGSGATQVLSASITSTAALAQGEKFSGSLDLSAYVKSPSLAVYTNTEQALHSAKYNLTRASNFAQTFNMPVNVLFYSSVASSVVITTDAAILTHAGSAFQSAAVQRPFLAKTNVEYGAITQHNHAYLSVVAKVTTDGTPIFKDLRVTKVATDKQGAGAVDKCTGGTCCSMATNAAGAAGSGTSYHSAAKWPQAYMYCGDLMGPSGPLADSGVGITAGDTLVISLQWKLVGQATSNGAGKAALLQDAADEVQSVEVSLTIQLGGGETTITTAGGSDGSADPTVTYIIIAVCIVAAGLILAVVVVAFMCMRNRSQEAIVSMSPQKCTVAAVYDISQPKKADAMDV